MDCRISKVNIELLNCCTFFHFSTSAFSANTVVCVKSSPLYHPSLHSLPSPPSTPSPLTLLHSFIRTSTSVLPCSVAPCLPCCPPDSLTPSLSLSLLPSLLALSFLTSLTLSRVLVRHPLTCCRLGAQLRAPGVLWSLVGIGRPWACLISPCRGLSVPPSLAPSSWWLSIAVLV